MRHCGGMKSTFGQCVLPLFAFVRTFLQLKSHSFGTQWLSRNLSVKTAFEITVPSPTLAKGKSPVEVKSRMDLKTAFVIRTNIFQSSINYLQ